MDDSQLEDLAAAAPALLQGLEALGFVARHLHPPNLAQVIAAIGMPDAALRAAIVRVAAWPETLASLRAPLLGSSEATLAAFDELRDWDGDTRLAFRALRHLTAAQALLYPLAPALPPVSRFFLEPSMRGDADLQARLARPSGRDDVGVMHVGEPGARGAFSLYVPETYRPEVAHPLVVALHGGSGNGAAFLWSWLRDARSHGAVVIAPTATGATWAITGPDLDTPNLRRMVDSVCKGWNIDPARLLLTGMSDGGTFSYVSGLEPSSPFTHLAPVAAAFHPMLAQMADPDRLRGLPIHLAHGALDWMFPIDMARDAQSALEGAGAAVTYREIADLSHTYPRELNPQILSWMAQTARPRPGPG